MILLIERIKNKILRWYRKKVFCKYTHNKKSNVNLVGKITLINQNIKIGNNVTIYPDVMFFGDGPIEVGDNVNIGNGTILYASKDVGIRIGSNTMIAAQCYIIDMDHGIKAGTLIRHQENTTEKVIIGEDVWLGAGVKVLKGSKIGDGAIIGAGSVVKGEIQENSIAVGVPAKIKKIRE